MRKNSIKNNRVNALVQRELSSCLRSEVHDPRIHILTSITACEVETDLKTCKVYVSVMGSQTDKEETLLGLRGAEGFLRSYLAKKINLRNTPKLVFILDESQEYGAKMSQLIDSVCHSQGNEDE